MIVLQIIFWLAVFAVFHSYIFYPIILQLLSKGKHIKYDFYTNKDELPRVFVLLAAYNEEKVIHEKIESIFSSNYPKEKIHLFVGSDASTDKTNEIIESWTKKEANITFKLFPGRTGKAMIVNQLVDDLKSTIELNESDVFLPTDANVIFDAKTIFELVKPFKDKKMGIVGANFINKGMKDSGISFQEQAYINREIKLKDQEGKLWGAMMGAFGGLYALRAVLYPKVPKNFLMEDFYISMHVIREKYYCIMNTEAICYEDVPNEISEEFKRKTRISAGNFQNLGVFKGMLFPPTKGSAFAFLSHKVLRWLGPFFIAACLICSFALSFNYNIYSHLFWIQIALLTVPLWDFLLKKIQLNNKLFRFIKYFYAMNLALFVGFIKYIKGVKTNVWQPTKRNK